MTREQIEELRRYHDEATAAVSCAGHDDGEWCEFCTALSKMATFAANNASALLAAAELVKYGCHCDIENTVSGEPDECVFDNGDIEDCVYATQLQREDKGKLQCKYWKPVSRPEPAEPEQAAETERFARIGKLFCELWEAGAPWP